MGWILRLPAAALGVALATAALAPAAHARTVAPFDAAPVAASSGGDTLLAPLFGLGEVDESLLGVSLVELASVGPAPTVSSGPDDAMLIVDNDLLDCPNAEFTSIQAAVLAASPGSKIKVCPGTYVEQVAIPATKSGLTLFSEGHLQARIQAPPVMLEPKAIVWVNGAQDVRITQFTITGPGGGPCDSIRWGVRVDAGGSALIDHNHITHIHDTPFSGCQNGVGVLVGRNAGNSPADATVVHNLIDWYQKGGVVVDGVLSATPVSTAEVAFNEVVGVGATPTVAQNGVQVSRGAVGNVHHNEIYLNNYAPIDTVSEGIIVFDAGAGTSIHHNWSYLNDDGVGVHGFETITTGVTVEYNRLERNEWDGIYFGPLTAENRIAYNRSFDNTEHDCHDDSVGPYPGAVANIWEKNHGLTQNRPGLCKKATTIP